MSKTFIELGIPFRLFQGPSENASEYCGFGTCSLCGMEGQHCFYLGIGCAIMLACPACGTERGLSTDDRKARPCGNCNCLVPFPDISDDEIKTCYDCLRIGKAAITKDTELGMISWKQAFEGITHGIPNMDHADFEMVPQGDEWVGVRLPQELMFEMLRTPTYNSIQGERWQFCCQQPMLFVGWNMEDFTRNSPDGDGCGYFEQVVQDTVPGLWKELINNQIAVYVFRCSLCERVTAHWDID